MNSFTIFSKNGEILPIEKALISLLNIEYSYGYGVYETLKVRNKKLYFARYHVSRLEHSAQCLDIPIGYSASEILTFLGSFVTQINVEACNIKIVLIGGTSGGLYIFASSPLFPDRKLYKQGAQLTTYTYERMFPTAKTLNMLPSYLAYTRAKKLGCYDALLIDSRGIMLEGTKTNFCLIQGNTIIHAPKHRILDGITLHTAIPIAKKLGFSIVEREVPLTAIHEYDGAFITSTSTKIMPIRKIENHELQIPESLRSFMSHYDDYLATE